MENKDFTVYYPLYDGQKFVTTPYSFLGTMTSFSDAKDAFDFFTKCFSTKEACDIECGRLNPIESAINIAADNYIGHSYEIDEDREITLERIGFKAGAHWVIKNFNILK